MRTMLDRSVVATVIVGLVLVAGCAKTPVATVSSAPAPAPAPTAPPPAPAPPPPSVGAAPTPPPTPVPRPAPPKEYRAHEALKPIYFAFDAATIRPTDAKILDANAAWLNANPGSFLASAGSTGASYTLERGTALRRQAVSGARRLP